MKTHPTKLRALVCAKAYPPVAGGLEDYGEQVVRSYLGKGIDMTVITAFPGERGYQHRDYPEGRARIFNCGVSKQPIVFARMRRAIAKLAKTEAFDFCHGTSWRPAAALLGRRNVGKLVVSAHGREFLITPWYLRPLLRLVFSRANAVMAVSRYTLGLLEQACGSLRQAGPWLASFNGISYRGEAEEFIRPTNDGPIQIYTFCRLVERKNIGRALQAVKAMRMQGIDNFNYVIAGKGPLFGEIEKLVISLGLADKVKLAGYIPVDDVVPNFKRAEIFLHPQTVEAGGGDVEGFGLVIADAMSFGALAIAGRDGGPADFIVSGETGVLVDGTNVESITQALIGAINDPAMRARMAEAGRRWCLGNLSWDRHVDDILAALGTVR